MKKAVGWVLIVMIAGIALWAAFWPMAMAGVDKGIAADHGHPFQVTHWASTLRAWLGTGGEGCDVAVRATTFSASDRIRVIGDVAPAGGEVKIDLFPTPFVTKSDGSWVQVDGYPAVRQLGSAASCVSVDLPPLPSGDYEVWVRVGDSGTDDAFLDFRVGSPS